MERVLIVDDNPDIREVLGTYAAKEGFEPITAKDGFEALDLFRKTSPAVILLDVMMPGMDGYRVCERIRSESDVPIILITAKGEDYERVMGLDIGADDYIVKPFSPGELVARVQAHIATYKRLKTPQETQQEITVGAIRICPKSHRVFVREQEVSLKNKEYELLLFLVTNADTVFDRETLYERIWGMDAMGDNATGAVHINRLREKLEEDPSHPKYIETVWGAGYRFHA